YGTIIHSDEGSQYTSHAYHRTLQHLGAIRAATLAKETAMTMLILNHAALILNLLSNMIQAIEIYIYHYY
ncbi:hypothetical protein P4U07_28080, partial [Bacillus mycoides]|uniref:hypothetical protein n=1 Tax=Bacillus mycoides TaxID=1405 RepID=UPI002E21BE54|nr:hypothetical protein [Bacillus mycoides]